LKEHGGSSKEEDNFFTSMAYALLFFAKGEVE
jgi:hypothetical protein